MVSKYCGNRSDINIINATVTNFVNEIKKDPKARTSAEIAFVTFSTNIEMDTAFTPVNQLSVPMFKSVEQGGTNMARAVLKSIEKIEDERNRLENVEIGYYPPFFILITDGNPDKNGDPKDYNRALATVGKHCTMNVGIQKIIIPFIIGIGDCINSEILDEYEKGFADRCFSSMNQINPEIFINNVFKFIYHCIYKIIEGDYHDSNQVIKSISYDILSVLRETGVE